MRQTQKLKSIFRIGKIVMLCVSLIIAGLVSVGQRHGGMGAQVDTATRLIVSPVTVTELES